MLDKIEEKSATVAVVDSSESVRMVMTSALSKNGFSTVATFSSIEDVKKHIRVNSTDWIITSAMSRQEQNIIDLLKTISSSDRLKNVRTSLLVDDEDATCLPVAFELGLLSYHPKSFNKESFAEEINRLRSTIAACGRDCTLTAACYARDYLQTSRAFQSNLVMAQSLVELYFGRPDLLLQLAEAQLLAGHSDDGRSTLIQAKLFDRTLEAKAFALLKKYGIESIPDDITDSALGDVGVSTVLIVDSDESVGKRIGELLSTSKVENVIHLADGSEAWEWLANNKEPDLIIQEWKIPLLSGPALLQRVRNNGLINVPIVVLSSQLKPKDGPLLSEMWVSNIVTKPFSDKDLLLALRWTILQENLPTDYKSLQKKIVRLLKSGKKSAASSARHKLFLMKDVSQGIRKYIESEFYYHSGDFARAKSLATESIKLLGKDSLHSLNVLGRCLLNLRDFKAAEQILEQAQRLSPQNFGRLIDIAEIKLAQNQGKEALDLVGTAQAIDPENPRALSAEIRAAISAKETKRAGNLMVNAESLTNIVSYMNNRAVALARTDKYVDAVELYKNTIESLPATEEKTQLTVLYNLGLCHCRKGNLEAAKKVLEIVSKENRFTLHKKAASLLKRVCKAINTGDELTLQVDSEAGDDSDLLDDLELDIFETIGGNSNDSQADKNGGNELPTPGETCLFGIFKPQDDVPAAAPWLKIKSKAA